MESVPTAGLPINRPFPNHVRVFDLMAAAFVLDGQVEQMIESLGMGDGWVADLPRDVQQAWLRASEAAGELTGGLTDVLKRWPARAVPFDRQCGES